MNHNKIMITILSVFTILIICIILLYFTNIKRITLNTSQETSIKIQSLEEDSNDGAWKWHEKVITQEKDIQNIVGFLNSIRYINIKQEQDLGFDLVIIIKGEKDNIFVFKGNVINVNGTNYKTLFPKDKSAHDICKNLNYTQTGVINIGK